MWRTHDITYETARQKPVLLFSVESFAERTASVGRSSGNIFYLALNVNIITLLLRPFGFKPRI